MAESFQREVHFLQCWEVDALSRDILATFSSNGKAMVRAKATSFTTDTTYLTVQKIQILYFPAQFGQMVDLKSLKSHVSFLYSWCLVNDGLISNFRCQLFSHKNFRCQLFSHKATLGFLPSSPCLPRAVSMTLLNQLLYIFTVHFMQFSDQYNFIEYQTMSSCMTLLNQFTSYLYIFKMYI